MPIIPEPDLSSMLIYREKQQALGCTIDRQIAALERQIQERRVRNQGHDPERREGCDRRSRVTPVKE